MRKNTLNNSIKLALILFILVFNTSFSNMKTSGNYCYWFNVNILKYEWKAGLAIYQIDYYQEGTLKEFQKALNDNLKKGLVAIGPFGGNDEAEYAYYIYNNFAGNIEKSSEELENEFEFFAIELKANKTGGFKINKVDNTFLEGNIEEFEAILYQKLQESYLLIGPFNPNSNSYIYDRSTYYKKR